MCRLFFVAVVLQGCVTPNVVDGGVGTDGGAAASDGGTGVACGYSYDAFNATASVNANSTVQWTCTETTRTVTANGLPDHEVGVFPNPGNPNTISRQTVQATMPFVPVNSGTANRITIVGFALNGVKFDPGTGGACDNAGACDLGAGTGMWRIEALGQTSFNFGTDMNNAHVQPNGEYHYHGMPERMLTGQQGPRLVGFALDGFPIYARLGYSAAMDATSMVRPMTGSYRLKATPDANRPAVTTYPMGAFVQDYEYAAGSGDLDECNGRTGVTPEFPQGTYHYYITDTYPFIGRCVKGTATNTGGMMMGGMMMGGAGMCMPGQTSMCCGDGTCDGPETRMTCAADCP
jgi:hypothetical protein